jgi:glycosyltransferase involved in cell wall biosynthesis
VTAYGRPPRVTVFVPAYDRARYIADTVRSVLAQTFADFELLVVDDGSTDRTAEIVAGFEDPRVRLERNGANRGIPYTRNRGLELARGAYLAVLDSDDLMLPGRLAAQVAFLDRHPGHLAIGAWSRMVDAQGRALRGVKRQPVADADVQAHLLFRCCINNRTLMARTAAWRAHAYRAEFPRCQDYDLLVRAAPHGALANLPRVLVLGRQHPGRYTGQTEALGRERKQAIAAWQLERLVVRYTAADLERHHALARLGRSGVTPDGPWLDWCEDWLARILAANGRARRYAPGALRAAAGLYWAKACARAPGGWRRFLRSPLAAAAGRNLAPRRRWPHLLSA